MKFLKLKIFVVVVSPMLMPFIVKADTAAEIDQKSDLALGLLSKQVANDV